MKRIFIFFGLLAFAVGGQAQMNQHSNVIGFNAGGGLNTLMYSPTDGTWNPKIGFLGELKYAHFFGDHFGVGFGVQFNYARAAATFNFRELTQGLIHPANPAAGLYESRTGYHDWKETQTAMLLSIPVEFYWRANLTERWLFLFGFGAQFDLPMKSEFKADEGSYELRGYFQATGVEYRNLPSYGFTVYNANEEGDIKDLKKFGISLIADLGFNYAMNNHWGLYLGLYGGYGITNLLDKNSVEPMLDAPSGTTNVNTYNGVINSVQTDEVHLFNVGAKIGLNFGWSCSSSADKDNKKAEIVSYEPTKPVEAKPVEAKPAEEKPVVDEATRAAEEAAAKEARRNARLMNNPDLAAALANIDADLADAERAANESGDPSAKATVANAKAKAEQAKAAYNNGQYGKAYDLFNEAYGNIADSYAKDARAYAANGNNVAKQAAEDAALYAEASRNGDLESAMAASRNAKINSEIARGANKGDRGVAPTPAEQQPAQATVSGGDIQKALDRINNAILFAFGSTVPQIEPSTDAALTVLAKAMAADSRIKIEITGHTDNIGSSESNLAFGLRRAEALKDVLVKRGAPAKNISVATKGEDEPVVENDTDEHRHQNRRAEIKLK